MLTALKRALALGRQVEDIADTLDALPESDTDHPPGSAAWNAELRQVFTAMGDDGTALREVIHFADPGADAAPKAALFAALAEYGVTRQCRDDMPNALFTQQAAVDAKTFDPVTEQLIRVCASVGWDYFGWEAKIVQGQ